MIIKQHVDGSWAAAQQVGTMRFAAVAPSRLGALDALLRLLGRELKHTGKQGSSDDLR